jgi:hypothetical protein
VSTDDLTRLPDSTLAHLLTNLERTVAALKCASIPFGALLLTQYTEALDAARTEAPSGGSYDGSPAPRRF